MNVRRFKFIGGKLIPVALLLGFLQGGFLGAEEADSILSAINPKYSEEEKDGYVINFTDISIVEYIRFVSKVLGVNFIFNEAELQFPVTIVSEEEVSANNVLSTLIQVLRIHNLRVLEQDKNLIISSSPDVKQIPHVAADISTHEVKTTAPLATRIFGIKNVNPASLVQIIRPMLSTQALIEVMPGSNLLIITDITTNIAKIGTLLTTLDTAHSPLEVDNYECKYYSPTKLIQLATQILAPFTEGTPFLLIPQEETNSIYIVATTSLIERTLTVIEDLDTSKKEPIGKEGVGEKVFIYKIQFKSPEFLLNSLKQIAQEMKNEESPSTFLISSLESVKLIKASNSLMFLGSPHNIEQIQAILSSIDTPVKEAGIASFYIYYLNEADHERVMSWLTHMADNLSESPHPDEGLVNALHSAKWMSETNALIFTGNEHSLARIKEILSSFDVKKKIQSSEASQFWMFVPKHRTGEMILSQVKSLASNLRESKLADPNLLTTLETARWVSDTHSLIFTGNAETLEQIKPIVISIDDTGKVVLQPGVAAAALGQKTEFFIYKPMTKSPQEIEKALTQIAQDLKVSNLADPMLLQTIDSMKLVESTESILFTGTEDSLQKVKALIERIDIPKDKGPTVQHIGAKTFLIYKLEYASPEKVIASLKAIAKDLQTEQKTDALLIETIHSAKVIQETKSILFMGPEKTLLQVENLAKKFDLPALEGKGAEIQKEASSNFVLYVPKYVGGDELITTVTEFKHHLMQTGVVDKDLFDTIDHLKWIPKTNSILISGTAGSMARTEELLLRFDLPTKEGEPTPPMIQSLETTSFLVYKLQYHNGSSIQEALKKVALELGKSDVGGNKQLVDAINSIQWIEVTNSLIGSGHQSSLAKLKELIRNLDTPLKQVFIEVLILETRLSNTQDFGLQWGGKAQYLDKFAAATGNFPPSTETIGPGRANAYNLDKISGTRFPAASDIPFAPEGFDLGIIGDIILHKGKTFISLGSLVSALQKDADQVILMNPKIITQDNKNSTIFVGDNIPFVGSQVSNQSANVVLTTSLEYRDLGLNLSITPTLSTSEVVTLDIGVDITEFVSTTNFGTSGVQGIESSHTSMNTRVTVPNKHFLVLSGMLQDTKAHTRAQIPCLGGLPIIGAAFSQNNRSDAKANILIFLKPSIINSFDEYRRLTEDQEILFKEESGPEIIQEEIQSGLEWVKCPEDD